MNARCFEIGPSRERPGAGSGRHGCIDGTPRGQRRPVLVVPAMRLGSGVVTVDLGVGILGAPPTTRAGLGLVMAGLTATGHTQKLGTVYSKQAPAGTWLTTLRQCRWHS
jgi:hypothetical protein